MRCCFFLSFFLSKSGCFSLPMASIDVNHQLHSMGKQRRFKTFSIAFTFKGSKMQAREFLYVFKACCSLLLQMWLPQ
jgi:hypothetical protein